MFEDLVTTPPFAPLSYKKGGIKRVVKRLVFPLSFFTKREGLGVSFSTKLSSYKNFMG
jgi:hypothetical protein